jgi:hypothetical protein
MQRSGSPRAADLLGLLLLVSATACSTPAKPSPATSSSEDAEPALVTDGVPGDLRSLDREEWHVVLADDSRTSVAWRPVAGVVPRNEPFDLELLLFRGEALDGGAGIHLRGWMPDHAHGQVQQALVTELEGGRYLVEGVLLHMRGTWQLIFEITEDASRATAEFVIEV